MNPKLPNELPYSEQVQFSLEPMQAFRDSDEPANENDVVLIFEGDKGLVAFAAGFRNMGMFTGMVMAMGAPIGFGKVLYLVNETAFIYYALFPLDTSKDENHTEVNSFNGYP